ncbi:MAG: DUF3784 domain-containing protein [Alkalibacterium sp.]|uniref:DUF3784 domain-containing protein n=1 Tax=Alkalibacterium gilvum TaxID=1130080 RepID=A0A1H6V747_9LACT|nr:MULTISPECIES: DUF3784 domain-containing protein [Alkalibacterium]MDN6293384.1 DUF3784 domain-containing protein [Alkalibacterium sp.]MDN6295331.1 DUF3784 domain-containing protein [Alkalibacterium sp.]MDN6327172.1 DUF3784 domain-containing protein [Alkalibacterium sp.]MDN6385961.1 DUF3784 domain-containing protein [Alkalibacterium sp.]MDN6398135.1 DUF3784 domain-containing protein [Alkalibacterium sp.]
MWTYIAMGGLFLLIGFAVHVLGWNGLISGYASMSEEQKAKVDIRAQRRILGIYGYVSGGFFLILAALEYFGIIFSPILALAIFLVWTGFILYYAQKQAVDQSMNKNDKT